MDGKRLIGCRRAVLAPQALSASIAVVTGALVTAVTGILISALISALIATLIAAPAAAAQGVVTGDRIEQPLAAPGDPARGLAIAADRQLGLCLLCHAAPLPDARFHGNLAPSLAGVGARYSQAQLRLRVVDIRRVHPDSLMPAFYSTDQLVQVGAAWRGRTILTAQQVEDVVAWLATLR